MNFILYDKIGSTYDYARRPDPTILNQLIYYLQPSPEGLYIDIGCGTGNYTSAFYQRTYAFAVGLDISFQMLQKAYIKCPLLKWIQGDAMTLPISENSLNGAFCLFATHHISNISLTFKETYRVLKKKSRFVIFTYTPEQMKYYWLQYYFPRTLLTSASKMASVSTLVKTLHEAGFFHVDTIPFSVTADMKDYFLYGGKKHPEIYLDPQIRAGIATFAAWGDQNEIKLGCIQLKHDIQSGKIHNVIQLYEKHARDCEIKGDCLFVISIKE